MRPLKCVNMHFCTFVILYRRLISQHMFFVMIRIDADDDDDIGIVVVIGYQVIAHCPS